MSGRLSREAYARLIAEDAEWLAKQPRTLEREHIAQILSLAVVYEYGSRIAEDEEEGEKSIARCFDETQPLACRLREVGVVAELPAWVNQFLYKAAREVEAMAPTDARSRRRARRAWRRRDARMANLYAALADSVETMSDEELLAEAVEDGIDPAEAREKLVAMLRSALDKYAPVSSGSDEDDGDSQCGAVGDPRDVRTQVCVLKPGHDGPHRAIHVGTVEIVEWCVCKHKRSEHDKNGCFGSDQERPFGPRVHCKCAAFSFEPVEMEAKVR